MKNLQEFINKQKIATEIKVDSLEYINNSARNYENNFYYNSEIKTFKLNSDETSLKLCFTFFLPSVNEKDPFLYKIQFKLNTVYYLKTKKLDMKKFEVSVLKEKVNSFYAFLLLHVNNIDKKAVQNMMDLFIDKQDVQQVTFSDMKRNYDSGTSNFHKLSTEDIKFTDFLIEMNKKQIQNILDLPIILQKTNGNMPKIVVEKKENQYVKESFDKVFDELIRSIYAKKDLNLKLAEFDNIIETIEKHDILNNYAKLVNDLPEKPNKNINKKI